MPPTSKKRKITTSEAKQVEVKAQPSTVEEPILQGISEDPSNSQKAMLSLPVELREEILDYFQKITFFTETPHDPPVLQVHDKYKIRKHVLRALSQLCVAYRRVFYPAIWETMDVCFITGETRNLFMDVGRALEHHCDGISLRRTTAGLVLNGFAMLWK